MLCTSPQHRSFCIDIVIDLLGDIKWDILSVEKLDIATRVLLFHTNCTSSKKVPNFSTPFLDCYSSC